MAPNLPGVRRHISFDGPDALLLGRRCRRDRGVGLGGCADLAGFDGIGLGFAAVPHRIGAVAHLVSGCLGVVFGRCADGVGVLARSAGRSSYRSRGRCLRARIFVKKAKLCLAFLLSVLCRFVCFLLLQCPHLRVSSRCNDQLLMGASLDDTACFHDQNLRCVHDGR